MVKPVLHTLDDTSLKFAKYFCLNHFEIDYIYKIFTKLLTPENPTFVNSSSLIAYIHSTDIELVKHLLSLYPDKKLTWDFFFQFTLLSTCSSTINLFYLFIFAFQDVEFNRISWDNIRQASLVLKTVTDCGVVYKQEFGRCDVNNDGFLTFQQFILLVSKNKSVWNPICLFRKQMHEHVFHIDQAVLILERRLKLPEVKLYQKYHNNQLPKLSCSKRISLLLASEPHPLLYSFDYLNETNTNCDGNKVDELSLESLTMACLYCVRPSTSVYRLVFNTDSISRILTGGVDDIDMYFMSRVKRLPLNDINNNGQGNTSSAAPSRSNSITKPLQQRLSIKEGDMVKKNSILRRSTFTTMTPVHRPSASPGQLPLSAERTRASGYYVPSNLVSRQTSVNQNGLLSRQTSSQPTANNNAINGNNNSDSPKKALVPPLNQINTLSYVKSGNDPITPHLVSPSSPTRIVVSSRANTHNV